MVTNSEINRLNRRFWDRENELFDRRIGDQAIREAALARSADEHARGVPASNQATLAKLLADAEDDKKRFLSQQGRKGGEAKQPDELQKAIFDVVRRYPDITAAELKNMLTRERFPGLIEDVDDQIIWFVRPDGSEQGRLKQATVSGLKDRLSRAKKALNSR